jgi:hypothetical protein
MRASSCLLVLGFVAGSLQLAAQPAVAVAVSATTAVPALVPGTTAAVLSPVPVVAPISVPVAALRLTNLSTRASVTADAPLVTGFAISGTTSRTVLVRAAGPALRAFGVAGALASPRLRLHDAEGKVVSENAGWNSATEAAAAIAATGAFPFAAGSADAALVATLLPGRYTAEVIAGDGSGVALVEVYDVDGTAEGSRLSNVSTLSTVSANGGEVISGFTVSGAGSQKFLVRGIGPALAKFNVGNALADPNLTVFNAAGTPISTNNDWSGSRAAPASAIGSNLPAVSVAVSTGAAGSTVAVNAGQVAVAVQAVQTATASTPVAAVTASPAISAAAAETMQAATQAGAFALDLGSADAALVVTLTPGAYTVQVNGVGSTNGTALLEIYELR